jgi:hypothetical protein
MALPFTIKARFRLTMKAVPFTLKAFRLTMKAVPFTLKAFRLTKKAVPWVTLTALMARLTLTALRCLTMKAVPLVPATIRKGNKWVTLKAFSRLMGSLIHSRLRTALLIVASARRRIFPQQMAAACAFFARPHSTTAKYPHARPSAGSARQRLFPRQILIATAIAFARVDSTFRTRQKNASP